jgi:GNAT superfamily N-acetyltransferase
VTGLTIRTARTADVPRIATVFREARSAAMPWLPVLHSSSEDVEFFGRAVEALTAYVAVLDDRVVGVAVIEPHEHLLEHLYLDPALRRRGIGTRLLDHARTEHRRPLQLWCFADNHDARSFYAARGARELYETDGSRNEERLPDVRLELPAWGDAPGDERAVAPQ